MPISIASANDLKGIEAIWKEQFTTDQEYLSIMFGEIIPYCTNYVCKVDGKVVSALSLMPMRFVDSTDNISLSGWYMFGVATLREFWGRKLAASTIQKAIEELETKGYQFIFERPANQSLNPYYLNLGFTKQLEYTAHVFPASEKSSTRNIDETAEGILNSIREHFTKRFEWEDKNTLKGLIKLGEVEFHNTIYAQNSPQGVYISINPLNGTKPEIFNKAFFCFPME